MAAPLVAALGRVAFRALARRTPGGAPGLILGVVVLVGGLFLSLIAAAMSLLSAGAASAMAQGGCGQQTAPVAVLADIPALPLATYQRVGNATGLDWVYLAAIGQIESRHGGPNLGPDGWVRPPVLGVRLDGTTPNTMVVRDTDRGALDGDRAYDRAVGPMQFLPGTWATYGSDGDGDGAADPNNYVDAVQTAARYLIAGGAPRNWQAAFLSYNRSAEYFAQAQTLAAGYRAAAAQQPGTAQPTGGPLTPAVPVAAPTTAPATAATEAPDEAGPQAVDGCGMPYAATPIGGDRAWGGHANGFIPASALCPVLMAPGTLVRCDAAPTVDAMSMAYRGTFGVNICIGNGYRSFPEQVAVKKAKPHLAATPGTSNHGWALAIDFCGGIETFDSPQHRWMQANAGRFGWFHPAWAQRNGSKPEAWHWEFSATP